MTPISNVKISVLVYSKLCFTSFIESANKREVVFHMRRNILVINDIFSITVFKKQFDKYHINITGIKLPSHVNTVIKWVVDFYCPEKYFTILKYCIDNITATFDIGSSVPLNYIASLNNSMKYNPERFPGLFYKTEYGTALIFNSGKVNIVGCKSENNVILIWQKIQNMLSAVTKKKIS